MFFSVSEGRKSNILAENVGHVFTREKIILHLTCLPGQFTGHVIGYVHLYWNEKRIQKNKGGVSDSWLDVRKRGGGGHSDAYCVQQGGGVGESKNR